MHSVCVCVCVCVWCVWCGVCVCVVCVWCGVCVCGVCVWGDRSLNLRYGLVLLQAQTSAEVINTYENI